MIEDRTKELIHAEIDGEIDDAGREELARALSGSDEARAYQAQMQDLEAFLDRVPAQEVPDGLHARIVGSISLPSARSRGWLAGFGQFPGFVRYGLATAAGLLIAVGVYEYRPGVGAPGDLSSMSGTILPAGNRVEDIKLGESRFEIDALASQVSLLRRGEALVLDFQVDAGQPVDLELELLGSDLHFDAIAQVEGELDSIEVSDQIIRIAADGRQHFAVVLRRQSPAEDGARVLMNWTRASKVLKTSEFEIN